MRVVKWTDRDGYNHLSWVRDEDTDQDAPNGLPHDPPDVNLLDWEAIKRELHNLLVDRELLTWTDVQRKDGQLLNAITTVMKRPLISLYRTKCLEGMNGHEK